MSDESSSIAQQAMECVGCSKEGQFTTQCPTCHQYEKSGGSYFCSQECFGKSWTEHKREHQPLKQKLLDELKTWDAAMSKGTGRKGAPPTRFLELFSTLSAPAEKKTWGTVTLKAGFDSMKIDDIWERDPHLQRFQGFTFTGKLRPWPLGRSLQVPESIPRPDYGKNTMGVPFSELRANKMGSRIEMMNEETISRLREAGVIGRKALDVANATLKPGVTTVDIDKAVHDFIVSQGAYPSPFNYYNFPRSCCTSVNEVICHGVPDLRPLEAGDICNVDVTVYYKGVHADLNETFMVGGPEVMSPDTIALVKGAYRCLMKAVAWLKPGMYYREIGNIIHAEADAQTPKLAVTKSYCGHGIHHLFHCEPSIPHYRNNKAVGRLQPGHCFTIEPMVNLGTWKDTLWPDDWTAVTQDGKWSAQFEHTLLVTQTGVEILTARLPNSPSLGFDTAELELK